LARLLTCPKCRALLDPKEKKCPYCGTDQRPVKARQVDEVGATTHFAAWILGINFAVYVLMVLLDPARGDVSGLALSPSSTATTIFGMIHKELIDGCGQYWRLVTAVFLHAGLLHLAFNSFALAFVAPLAARTFGPHRTICIYLGTGLAASFASYQWSSGYSLGASGAICGMIAALAVYGWRRGGMQGQMLARQMFGWIVFIAVMGYFMRHVVDNVGHGAGFVGGAALGYLGSAPRAIGGRIDRIWAHVARLLAAAAIIAGVVWMVPNVAYGLQARDARLFRDATERTLGVIQDVRAGKAEPTRLPARAPEGPWGAGDVEKALDRALAAARTDPSSEEAVAAFSTAAQEFVAWRHRLKCMYGIGSHP
jgi:rhomboid protease GluP